MGEMPENMRKIREMADEVGGKCKNCGHVGLAHPKKNYAGSGRERGKVGEFGKCTVEKCTCTQFIPE